MQGLEISKSSLGSLLGYFCWQSVEGYIEEKEIFFSSKLQDPLSHTGKELKEHCKKASGKHKL